MDLVNQPKSEALRALYWRSEILQLMYWLKGEGFGDQISPNVLERFLGVEAKVGVQYLDRLVDEGYVMRSADRYELSEIGHKEGGVEFVSSFAEMTRPTHGECSADCWCHSSPDEAEACAAERIRDHDHDNHDHAAQDGPK